MVVIAPELWLGPVLSVFKKQKALSILAKGFMLLTGQQMDCSPLKASCAGFTEHSCRSWDIF